MDARIVKKTQVYDGWLKLSTVVLRLPNGATEERHIEDHGDSVSVLTYDPHRRVALLVQQPRAPLVNAFHEPLLEVVAGRLDGKSPEDAARSEALEEVGIQVDHLEWVATVWLMPAISTERKHLYLAAYEPKDRIGPGGGAITENECIIVREVELSVLWSLAAEGLIQDSQTLMLVQALKIKRPELFEKAMFSTE
jgi:nudix-type nucleoside diphosphatase (YffH/AdpP family)